MEGQEGEKGPRGTPPSAHTFSWEPMFFTVAALVIISIHIASMYIPAAWTAGLIVGTGSVPFVLYAWRRSTRPPSKSRRAD